MKELAEKIALWREKPQIMVRELFHVEPTPQQDEILAAFPHQQRIAMKASKGTGKTCTEAWLAWNFLLSRPNPKIAATSVSSDNLADNLWTEMALWRNKSPLLQHMFEWTKTRIFAKDHPETWWMSARTWAKNADKSQQANTLAGLHADYIMFILDESGDIPDAVMASAEAALSSCIEGHLIQGGNPTSLSGPLYRACTAEKGLWYVVEMTGDPDNPKRSPRVDINWAKAQIEKYGRDNPWVLVNVFGQFPPAAFNALIGIDDINAAIARKYREQDYEAFPRIIGVDVARFGDDSSILFPRQGLQAFQPLQYRNIDGTRGAELTVRKWNEWDADACFVDDTGGFGSSWIDNLIRLGKDPIGIAFSSKAINDQYYNKRTEMAFELTNWLKRGGAIPNIPNLTNALLATTYTFKGDQIILEPKEDIKVKLNGNSPDEMDALMLTFAQPIDIDRRYRPLNSSKGHQVEYNPFDRSKVLPGSDSGEYIINPYS